MFSLSKTQLAFVSYNAHTLDVHALMETRPNQLNLQVMFSWAARQEAIDNYVQCGGERWILVARKHHRILKNLFRLAQKACCEAGYSNLDFLQDNCEPLAHARFDVILSKIEIPC
jgi:hypothetical protein